MNDRCDYETAVGNKYCYWRDVVLETAETQLVKADKEIAGLKRINTTLLEALEQIERWTWVEDRGISDALAIESIFDVARAAIKLARGGESA